ncbi:MAG: T9SS C-terminal target domain-containing protein [Bacteroidetes bacterium]|nr:MAG: T9SS C-terminal target domain-containing protein [Bacteroidota bacterium]
MKHLVQKTGIILGLILAAFAPMQAQVCTPDTNLNAIGLSPDSLPPAYVGEAYSQVIQAVLPTDTSIGPITFAFCSYRILNTAPDISDYGLSFECDQPACTYIVDHSQNVNRGCLVVSGTPTDTLSSITVNLEATIGTYNATADTCIVSNTLVIPYTVNFQILDTTAQDTNSTSIYTALTRQDLSLTLAPNPSGGATTLRYVLPERTEVQLGLYDLMGREVHQLESGHQLAGEHALTFEPAGLPDGIYLVRLRIDGGALTLTEKWVLRR